MKEPVSLQTVDRTHVRWGKRTLTSFSGCDYFRMASHPRVLKAAQAIIAKYGLSVSASRRTTGNHAVFLKLEQQLAEYFAAESALLVSTGYAAAQVAAQALAGNFSHALIDEKAHPALQNAALFLDCPVIRFSHRNVESLQQTLTRLGPNTKPIVLTDGLFASDGSVAPLKLYLRLLPREGRILVDDAHAAGVIGNTGKGSLEVEKVDRSRIIQCITLSKAFGAYGGAILGTRRFRSQMLERSRAFIGSTAIPLPLAGAALEAIALLRRDPRFRQRLIRNIKTLREKLVNAGFALSESPAPIVPILTDSKRETTNLKRELLSAGIFPPLLQYPGNPSDGYFRFVISSEHSSEQLDCLAQVLVGNHRPQSGRKT
jgi:7-keto-8-aminopelargonate synthetase and related enzymes